MTQQNTRAGIALMIAAVAVFSLQDGLSRHLATHYNTLMVLAIRYWFFAAFVIMLALRQKAPLAQTVRTRHLLLHLARAALLVVEVCAMVQSYALIGLVNTHAVFSSCPLIIVALSGPILGERVGWQRWLAILAGFGGILFILQPGSGVFSLASLLPLASALMYALYSVLTRMSASTEPSFRSLFWSGMIGAVLVTPIGLWNWEPMTGADWGWMALYGTMAMSANWLLIKCYEVAEASAVQPYAYLQLVFASALGIVAFGEVLQWQVVTGAAIVVAAGIVALWQDRHQPA